MHCLSLPTPSTFFSIFFSLCPLLLLHWWIVGDVAFSAVRVLSKETLWVDLCIPLSLLLLLRTKTQSYFTTDSQSASLSWCQATIRAREQFFFLLKIFLRQSRVCYFVAPSLTRGRVCNLLLLLGLASAVILWSESCGTQDQILLSPFLRLPQPGGPGPRIYIPQEQGGPVIPPGTGFLLRRLLWLASYDSHYGGGILTRLLTGVGGLVCYTIHVASKETWRSILPRTYSLFSTQNYTPDRSRITSPIMP
jgi:hypothetical protein